MFLNRIRLPFYFSRPQFPVERNIFRRADGSRQVLTASVSMTYEGKTDLIPKDWHQKLVIALSHDVVNIEGDALMTEVVLDSDYGIDWSDFLDYPVAQANFTVQVTPFNATNSNCQTCDEIAQLDLTDDTTDDCFTEGTTNDFPFSVFDNDSICCYPFVASIASYNTTYFSAVSIDADGIITFTVNGSVPSIGNVLLATYRVTCPNGAYDEANVYVCIEGTSTECVAPTDLLYDSGALDWNGTIPAPDCGYNWVLYLASDIYTPIASGNTAGLSVDISAYTTPGESYVATVQSDCCAYDFSDTIMTEFIVPDIDPSACGNFLVSYDPTGLPYTANYSYMDCAGLVQNGTLISFDQEYVCMLIPTGSTTPTFFAADPGISIQYIDLC